MEHCTKTKILLFKILENVIRYKIKIFALFWLKFWQNTHLDSKNMLKNSNFKNFQIWTPARKNFKYTPISPIFGQKFPYRDLLIYFRTWNFLAFKMYICGTFWKNFMVIDSCVQYLWPFCARNVRVLELWFWHRIQDSWFVPQIPLTDSAESC